MVSQKLNILSRDLQLFHHISIDVNLAFSIWHHV